MSRPAVFITGASQGIGRATAERFAADGWRVITCARSDAPPETRGHPGWTDHLQVDLAQEADTARAAQAVLALLDGAPLHALVNNAGVSPKTPFKERLGVLTGSLDLWRGVFSLNFFAALDLTRRLIGPLAAGRGSVVNVTSIAGHAVHPFAGSAYAASKAALSALTRRMAAEFGPLGVRVNAVAPGEIKTDMISPEYEKLIPRIPMEAMGSVEEVAGVIAQLCGRDFAYVTGAEIFITGGQHLL